MATARSQTLFTHLDFQGQPWYDGGGDYICAGGPITTLGATLPAGQYTIATADKRPLWTFDVDDDAPPGSVVANYDHCPGDACTLGICPYGTGDFHAAYLINYFTGAVVGTAGGGFSVNSVPVVGGERITVSVPVAYTCTYGAIPPDMNDTGGDGGPCSPGMAQYSLNKLRAALVITDTPIAYQPPRGPAINFTLSYNSKARQPGGLGFPHLGPGWTFNWYSYLIDDPNNVSVTIYLPGGGIEQTGGYNSGTQAYAPDPYSKAVLAKVTNGYERRLPDGSKQVFTTSEGAGILFMTQWKDKSSNAVILTYDLDPTVQKRRLRTITDALGKNTTLYYADPNNGRVLTSIGNDFGKSATFSYTGGKLTAIQDPVGIVSTFEWDGHFINSLTTPYGETTFEQGGSGSNTWIEATDPELGKERVEYRDAAPGIAPDDPADTVPPGFNNAALDIRNSFYWDKKAMLVAPGDYTKARIQHWLLGPDGSFVSRVPSSEKAPLENRIWYLYPEQSDSSRMGSLDRPSTVARMLDPSTPQISQFKYNSVGNTIKATDPTGRVTSYEYAANKSDLETVYQRNPSGASLDPEEQPADKIAAYTYNSVNEPLHEPLTATDAAGQTTTYTYNANGQVLEIRNAKFETTTYGYGDGTAGKPVGYLTTVTSPAVDGSSAITSVTYDTANRMGTVTASPDNYTITIDYDALDRKTRVTYPDATYEEFQYTQDFEQVSTMILDLTGSRDRLGRWTYRHYNGNRQMDSSTDPENRTTLYGWCTCGSLNNITDPNGNVTTFNRDLQGRVYRKVFADNTAIDFLFEGQTAPNTVGATSRLQSSTDAKSQRTNYVYFSDNTVQQISYTDTASQPLDPPTPSVSYTYDSNYNRIEAITDDVTGLTSYEYYPIASSPALGAGKVKSVNGPLDDDTISVTYDELGRVLEESINKAAQTMEYDSLGRLGTITNALGVFTRTYDGLTSRPRSVNYPNGHTRTYSYFGNNEDRRLQTLENIASAGMPPLISQFDYTYDDEGQIMSWTSLLGATNSGRWFEYDDARQLLSTRDAFDLNSATRVNDYEYDDAANRISDLLYDPQQPSRSVHHSYAINEVNQINSISTLMGGISTIPLTLVWDLAGNLTNDGDGRTFEWDAAHRLIAIDDASTGNRTEFTYDGLSRRVKIVESTNATITSTKQFVWVGTRIAEERDANNAVTRRYFAEGEERSDSGLCYYTRDHLGSIRELTDSSGVSRAWYDYDPYGKRTKLGGDLDVDFGYTGHYFHAPSGLNLTLYRAYNPALGRWLSRDPIGEHDGTNLYAYVGNDPITSMDPFGLSSDGGPYHPPSDVKVSCNECDSCPRLRAKMIVLMKMIASHTGWDRHMPPPRGGGRHAGEIADLWRAFAKCQAIHATKACNDPEPPGVWDRVLLNVPGSDQSWRNAQTGAYVVAGTAIAVAVVVTWPVAPLILAAPAF